MDGAAAATTDACLSSGGHSADISALTVSCPRSGNTSPAVAKAAALLAEQGLVVCSSQLDACCVDEIHHACRPVEAAVLSQLARRNLSPHYGGEETSGFRFTECASRCPGRVDMRCNATQQEQEQEQEQGQGRGDGGGGGGGGQMSLRDSWQASASGMNQASAPLWREVVRAALGRRCKLCYGGLVMNLPGSHDQGWHVDAPALFSSENEAEADEGVDDGQRVATVAPPDLPPHALTVFVPLCPPEPALGPTEFFCGSHRAELRAALEDGRLARCGAAAEGRARGGVTHIFTPCPRYPHSLPMHSGNPAHTWPRLRSSARDEADIRCLLLIDSAAEEVPAGRTARQPCVAAAAAGRRCADFRLEDCAPRLAKYARIQDAPAALPRVRTALVGRHSQLCAGGPSVWPSATPHHMRPRRPRPDQQPQHTQAG
jgi:hypothetical protein